VTAVH